MLIKVHFFLYTYNEPLGVFGSFVLRDIKQFNNLHSIPYRCMTNIETLFNKPSMFISDV